MASMDDSTVPAEPPTPTADASPTPDANPIPAAAARSKKAKRGGKSDASTVPKKRGNPGVFSEKRVKFMKEALVSYGAYQAKKSKKRRGSGLSFWDTFFPRWWKEFPWRLQLKQDPPADPDELSQLACDPADDDEIELKKKTITETENKVIWWFNRQGAAEERGQNPWREALKSLRAPQGPPPRRPILWQYYQQHEEFKEALSLLFEERGYHERPSSEHLRLRAELAQETWTQESEDVRARITREAEEEHAEAVAEHEEASAGTPSLDPAIQAEARRRLAVTVKPMLDLIRAYTGYELTLLAGRVDLSSGSPKVSSTSVHAAVTTDSPAYKDFSRANVAQYNTVMAAFSKFVVGSHLAEENAGLAPVSTTDPAMTGTVDSAEENAGLAPVSIDPATAATESTTDPAATDPAATVAASSTPDAHPETLPVAPPVAQDPLGHMRRAPGPYLRAELLSMPVDARETRINLMRIFSVSEMEREENKARNYATMVSLGLVSAPTWAEGRPAGKKRKGKSTGGKKKKQRRDSEGWSSQGENEDDEDEADEGDADESPPAPRPPRPKRGQAPKATAPAPAASSKWATAAREQLKATELGPVWTDLVALWFQREESYGFVSPRDSHKAKLRPSQIGEWVARARAPRYKPLIPDPAKFGRVWRAWWIDINPSWRQSVDGQLVRMGTGEWEGLNIPGANGFLNVLICLKWWGDAINGTPEADWDDAVADVNWVLQQMVGETTADSSGNMDSSGDAVHLGSGNAGGDDVGGNDVGSDDVVGNSMPVEKNIVELSEEERAEMDADPEADENDVGAEP